MLVDHINRMSESEQKTLWLQINKDRLSLLAKEIDKSVISHSLTTAEIDEMISEAKNARANRGRPAGDGKHLNYPAIHLAA